MFTALFILVIAGTTRSSAIAGFAGIPIGLMLTLVHMISIPIDNTSVNPARSFSTALFAWKLHDWWALEAAVGVHRLPDHRRAHRRRDLDADHHAGGRGHGHGGKTKGPSLSPESRLIRELIVTPGRARAPREAQPGAPARASRRRTTGASTLEPLLARLDELHNRLWAEAKRSVLLVLQGMDASGKDGTVRRVLTGLNPQGCDVTNFKEPTTRDLAHDYLWRVHELCPPRGILGVMNRSHYEDVVTARLIGLVDDDQCRSGTATSASSSGCSTTRARPWSRCSSTSRRTSSGRASRPASTTTTKNWKFQRSDLEARRHWDAYQQLYDEVIGETSTKWAPWYVVPADHKWVRDVAVATLLVDVFERLDPRIPDPEPDLRGIVVE